MRLFTNLILRFPRSTILLCLALCGAALLGMLQFTLSYDTRVYFNPEGRDLASLRAFEAKYGQNNNILIVVSAEGRKITEPEVLAALGELVTRAWTLPHSTRVDALTNFPHVVSDADSFSVGDLVPYSGVLSAEEAREIERIALKDHLIRNRLLSEDAQTAGILVNFNLPEEASTEVLEIVTAARALAATFEADHPGIDVQLTGNVMLMATFSEAAMNDVMYLIPISLMVTGLVMFIFVRALLPSVAILTLLGLSSATAMGLAGWYGYDLNTSTVSAPIIVMTVNMAAAIRFVTTALAALGRGLTPREAIAEAVSINFLPITLTSLTTIAAFLSMNLADAPPLRQQGNVVAIGVFLAYIFTFTWLPAVLSLMPLAPTVQNSERFMVMIGRFVNRYYKQLFVFCAGVVVACAMWLGNIQLDDDFARYFDERFEYRQASDFAEQNLTGLNVIEFDIPSGEAGGVFLPSYQSTLAAFQDWLRAQPGVVSAAAISEITKRVHDAMKKGGGATGNLPDNRETIAQYFLLYELSLPFGASLNDQIDVNRSSSRVTAILRNMTSSEIRAFDEKATAWLVQNAPPEMQVRGTGLNVIFANLSGLNIRSMISASLVSVVVIAVIMIVALRSFTFGMLSVFLNMLPLVVGFGLWGLLYQNIGLAASVVTAMTIGLILDDTIYFLLMYRQARQKGLNPEEAINYVFSTVGVAILVITVSLTLGFGVLIFSGFEVNRTLGAMTAIVILANLFIDWLMLPPVIRLVENSRARAEAKVQKVAQG